MLLLIGAVPPAAIATWHTLAIAAAGGLLMAFGFLAVGWLVTLLAIVIVEPLRGYVLRTGRRKE